MEDYALGFAGDKDLDLLLLGVRREGSLVYLRYAQSKEAIGITVEALRSSFTGQWNDSSAAAQQIEETASYIVYEVALDLNTLEDASYLRLRINYSPQSQ